MPSSPWTSQTSPRATLLVAVVATTALSLVALDGNRRARSQARAATVLSLTSAAFAVLDTDPEASILLALEAVDRLQATGQKMPGNLLDVLNNAAQGSRVLRRFEPGLSADLSPDATLVATTGEGGELFLWEAETGDLVAQLTDAGDDHVNALKFAPDGLRLAAARLDGRLQIWDVAARRLEREMPTLPEVFHLSWSGDARFVAVGGVGGMRVWETDRGEITYAQLSGVGNPIAAALNVDGSLAAYVQPLTADVFASLANVDIRRMEEPNRVIARLAHPMDANICVVSFDPSGDRIATGAGDGMVSIWSLDSLPPDTDTTDVVLTEPTALLEGHRGAVCGLEWSADGTQLVTGSVGDATARLWDVASAREVVRLIAPGGAGTSVSIADSGRRMVTATLDGVTQLWDLTPGGAGKQVIMSQ